jgi:hypothetical protein
MLAKLLGEQLLKLSERNPQATVNLLAFDSVHGWVTVPIDKLDIAADGNASSLGQSNKDDDE